MGCCSDNVLWLFEYPTLNGGERSLLATLPTLRAEGFRIAAAGPPDGPLAGGLKAEAVPLHPIDWRGGDDARRPLNEARADLAALLRSHTPALLHANSLSMGRLAGPVAVELGVPSIAHVRDIVGLSAAAVADLARNRRLLAVSAATRDFHVRQGLTAERTHVLHNGVDLARFRPRAADGRLHRELGMPSDALLIGTVGQIILRKGLDVLAAAAVRLADRLPTAQYVIVGSRYSRKDEAVRHDEAVRQAFATGGLTERVHFLGERDDVADLLPELTLLVHPARQEPLGRVLLEAAACGLAIVATDVGGTREVFADVECSSAAHLVPPDDPEALAAAIQVLATDPVRRAELGQAARRRAEAAFDARAAAAGLAEHYRRAIDGRDAAVSTDGASCISAPLDGTSGSSA